MESVHGISVAGGTFPAQIWRLFMQPALQNESAREFALPKQWPVWTDFDAGPRTPTRATRTTRTPSDDSYDDTYYTPTREPDAAPAASSAAPAPARSGSAAASALVGPAAAAAAPRRAVALADSAAPAAGLGVLALVSVLRGARLAGRLSARTVERRPPGG